MDSVRLLMLRSGRKVFTRQFLPATPDPLFDLVLSSYAADSLLSEDEGLWQRTVDVLWGKTAKYLVVVEAGTNAGFTLLSRIRDRLLAAGGHVLAPCPHSETCPRFSLEKLTPCAFAVSYRGFLFADKAMKADNHGDEQYSYLVVRKGGHEPSSGAVGCRVIRPVQVRRRHVIVRMCCPDGQLREVIASRGSETGPKRDLWKFAKTVNWGDVVSLDVGDKPTKAPRGPAGDVDSDER